MYELTSLESDEVTPRGYANRYLLWCCHRDLRTMCVLFLAAIFLAVMFVWGLRGKTIRTLLHCVLHDG